MFALSKSINRPGLARALFGGMLLLLAVPAWPEIIYLKDGQVVKGAIIDETRETVTVQGKYQTQTIERARIQRIMFGEREMEKIYILFKDETTIQAWLIDQDNKRLIVRLDKNSPKETEYSKENVSQTSADPIFLYKPVVGLHLGFLNYFNSGGGELDPAITYTGSYNIRLPFLSGFRFSVEAGFSQASSSSNDGLSFLLIPVLGNLHYDVPLRKWYKNPPGFMNQWMVRFKLGGGSAFNQFNNGEDLETGGFLLLIRAGSGIEYPVSQRFSVLLDLDYILMKDTAEILHTFQVATGAGYRY